MLGAIIAVQGAASVSANHLEHLLRLLTPLTDEVALVGGTELGSQHRLIRAPRGMSELAAVAEVLTHAGADHALIVAADLKWPSPELLHYLVLIRAGHEAVVPEGPDGTLQPMLALYHGRIAARARGLVSAGERELVALLEGLTVRRVTVDEVAKFGDPKRLLQRGPI